MKNDPVLINLNDDANDFADLKLTFIMVLNYCILKKQMNHSTSKNVEIAAYFQDWLNRPDNKSCNWIVLFNDAGR